MTSPSHQSLAETLQTWLLFDSTTGREKAFLEHLEERFEDAGWQCERQDVSADRWNLVIDDGEPTRLLFSTHVDTVPPHLPVRQQEGRIHGRGACDTKGGLLAMWHAAETLRRQGVKGLGFLLVVGEEVDHIGAIKARELDLNPRRILLCEPTQNRVVSAQKGMLRFTLQSSGVAGHSAFPGDGHSALEPMLDALEGLRQHRWPTDDTLGATTFNIGVLQSGVAANIFAPEARAELLFRATGPIEELFDELRPLLGEKVTLADAVYNDPVFFDPPDEVPTCTVPFNTDATYLGELGPVWLVGPGDIRLAHGDEESIGLDEIVAGIERYLQLSAMALHLDIPSTQE